jgi:hypothetical protein
LDVAGVDLSQVNWAVLALWTSGCDDGDCMTMTSMAKLQE